MKVNWLPKIIITLLFLSFIVIQACEGEQPSLIGKWQSASNETFEFFKDGTVRMRGDTGPPLGVQTFIGNYRLIEGNQIRIDMAALGSNINLIFAYSISRDTLTLKNEERGQVSTYHRVEGATMVEGSGLSKQMGEASRQQAEQPLTPKSQAGPLPQLEAEPSTPRGSLSTPVEPGFVSQPPRAAPPLQTAWGGRWPWTSGRLIQLDDLGPLSLVELELMRNEIFARHGWVFNRRDLQDYFSSQPWYSPKGDSFNREQVNRRVQNELTLLEKKNLQIIVSRENALKR